MVRLFVGIPIPEDVRKKLSSLLDLLKKTDADISCVAPQNLHLTIKFLGEVGTEQEIKKIKEILSSVKYDKFMLHLDGVGAFPSLERINVIWVGVKGNIIPLIKKVESRLDYIRKNDHPYEVPHLTIARVKKGRNRNKLHDWIKEHSNRDIGFMEIDRIVLYSSELKPDGPVYTYLAEFHLS